ncbi:hypothetical protein M2283_009450 [Streptomyces pseudovenezuelae]|uniref:Uncharacterized protein n=1 Tax=Streptomyces pseudovenezuelae TaxID=67350 RepID=A0ABT6M0R9_9ACTN|nr:hypothetical protein [Streptomyces pseudovenezuelae]
MTPQGGGRVLSGGCSGAGRKPRSVPPIPYAHRPGAISQIVLGAPRDHDVLDEAAPEVSLPHRAQRRQPLQHTVRGEG